MAKSKRNKIVHLTQVKKKGKDHKEDLMKQIEQYVTQFSKVYIFNFDSTKSDRIMLLRLRLKEFGRIFAGRNAVVTAGLKAISSRTGTNFDDLINQITGHRGLLFTDASVDKIVDIIDKTVPEFREKLLGYVHIAPDTKVMDVDEETPITNTKSKTKSKTPVKSGKDVESNSEQNDDEHDDNDRLSKKVNKKNEIIKKKKSVEKSQTMKQKAKKGTEKKRHEVKFIKI